MRFYRIVWSLVLCALVTLPASVASARSHRATADLTFALWDKNQIPAMQKIITKFQQRHPDVRITIQQTPWAGYWNKLATLTAGGSSYDVFWMNGPSFPTYASKGALLDLTPYLRAARVDLSRYPQSLINLYTWKGRHYALVKDMDTIGLWYNKTLFQRAHVPFPTCSWTWQDYANAAKKLTVKKGGRTTQYGTMIYNAVQQIYGDIFAEYGGSILNASQTRSVVASPQNVATANLLQGMIKDGSAMVGLSNATLTQDLAFEAGRIAMVLDGSWMVIPYTTMMNKGYTAGVSCLPSGPKGRHSIIHGLGMVVGAHTKHPKEAAEFAIFLASPYAANVQAATGTVIPAMAGTQTPWLRAHPDLDLKVFLSEIPGSVQFPASLGFNEWWSVLQTDFDTMLLGKKSPKETLTLLQKQMNSILVKYYPTA
jgi:multiple sugar transport system substrate-binding protein